MKWCKHGGSYTPAYNSWAQMLQRCLNPKNSRWNDYGGRGITVCEQWQDFDNFLEDMGPRPKGTTLDRIDGDGPYNASNCRWATPLEQGQNTRRNLVLTVNGVSLCLAEWARRLGINKSTLAKRLGRSGWSIVDALSIPTIDVRQRRKGRT